MKAGILSSSSRIVLLNAPLWTPTLVGLEKPEEAGLAMRVTNLFSFRRQDRPILVKSIPYQGKEGAWLVALAFRLVGAHTVLLEDRAYLNPSRARDLQLLRYLIIQDRLPVLFFSPHLRVRVSHVAEWTVMSRQELRHALVHIPPTSKGERTDGEEDQEFERVKEDFERHYSPGALLQFRTGGRTAASSVFRGAVLE